MGICTEGCRQLDGPVPLKPGESHCVYCSGYGAHPIQQDDRYTQTCPYQCGACCGMGKDRSTLHPDTYVAQDI